MAFKVKVGGESFDVLRKAGCYCSLLLLTRMMYAHFGKPVILLIDEYDVPLAKANEEEAGERYHPQMLDVIRGIMSTALKPNDYLKFGVVTGCLRIAKESIFTGVNNFASYSVLDRHYWKNTSSNSIIRDFVERTDFRVKGKFETLMNGGTIIQTISDGLTYDSLHETEDNLWSVLLMTGYLKIESLCLLLQDEKALRARWFDLRQKKQFTILRK